MRFSIFVLDRISMVSCSTYITLHVYITDLLIKSKGAGLVDLVGLVFLRGGISCEWTDQGKKSKRERCGRVNLVFFSAAEEKQYGNLFSWGAEPNGTDPASGYFCSKR